jgi:aminoglycoside phosphotransferase (APT) family kinase protein
MPLSHRTPGSNAVFAVGNTVCKVYAPEESTANYHLDYAAEISAMRAAQEAGLPIASALANGEIQDRYLFRYLITELHTGRDAGIVLPTLQQAKRESFARRLADLCAQLRRLPLPENVPPLSYPQDEAASRLQAFSPAFRASLLAHRAALAALPTCYTHGDITAENVLLGDDGSFVLIDFADSQIAPPCYELAPILLDLFAGDPALARAFCASGDMDDLLAALIDSLALHRFGGGILKAFLATHTALPPGALRDLSHLRKILRAHYAI